MSVARQVPTAIAAAAAELKARAAGRQRDVIDVRQPAAETKLGPTPEQRRHHRYVEERVWDVRSDGTRSLRGKAHRRQPRFMRLAGVSAEQKAALVEYRRVFDRSEQSETRCALDVRPRGTGGSTLEPGEAVAAARQRLAAYERGVGAIVDTLRAVALMDMSYRELAMQRWGSREVSRIDVTRRKDKVYTTIEPLSGRHREIVRAEFLQALLALEANVRPYLRTGGQRR